MDLFTPCVPADRLHPNFKHVAFEAAAEDRAVLNAWADGFVDRDGKFVVEFQTTFNSSFWELYLFAVLKELRQNVDMSVSAPDFSVIGPPWDFGLEATIASHEYREEYARLDHVRRRPFVLAVAPFEQPLGRVQNTQAIMQTLYGATATPYEVVSGEGEDEWVLTGGEFIPIPFVTKATGAEIPLGLFRNRRMQGVSAVVFSSTATWGKVRALSGDPNPDVYFEFLRANSHGPQPTHGIMSKAKYEETLLDGLCVFHNPDATYPLAWKVFQAPRVTQVTWSSGHQEPFVESEHGVLLQRTVITTRKDPTS